MRMDRSAPYGTVIGAPGVAFEQNGRFFNPLGLEVTEDGGVVVPGPESESEAPANAAAHKRALKAIYGEDAA
jgi:hypothetical protein